MTHVRASSPRPVYRLIPSQFPPIALFDTVTIAADLPSVLELVGWTNDRLVVERLNRLSENEWVFGIPNSSIVMAVFLHGAPGGTRFNGPDLGAWYASSDIRTGAAEVAHHLRREAVDRGRATMSRKYRTYTATLLGQYLDIRGQQTIRRDIYASDSYVASQKLGEQIRSSGGDGILYDSLRRQNGVNIVAHRPRNITEIVQATHFEITISATSRIIDIRELSGE